MTKLPEQQLSGQQTEYYQGDSIKADGIVLMFLQECSHERQFLRDYKGQVN